MILHYSPFFNGNCFIDYKVKNLFGEKVVNDQGLLEELELRLGLSCLPKQENDRLVAYRAILEQKKSGKFYEASFDINPRAVSENLLSLRDKLVMSGFELSRDYKARRLKELSLIEEEFSKLNFLGEPDRWKRVLKALETVSPSNLKVKVYCHGALIQKIVENVLSRLDVKHNKDKYDNKFQKSPDEISVVTVQWQQQAYEYMAKENLDKESLLVCNDSHMMLRALQHQCKPCIKSKVAKTSPKILLLFKQIFNLYSGPIDLSLLRDYLQQEISPIPSVLRRSLVYALSRQSGIGELWEKGREDYIKTANSYNPTETEDDRRHKLEYLEPLERHRVEDDVIDKKGLVDFITSIKKWSSGICFVNDKLTDVDKSLLKQFSAMCEQLRLSVSALTDNQIKDVVLKNMVLETYSCYTADISHAEVGAMPVVDNLCNQLEAPSSVHWLDSSYSKFTDPYCYLLSLEREELEIADSSVLTSAYHDMQVTYLNQVRDRIHLYLAKSDENGELGMNPLVSELLFQTGKIKDVVYACGGTNKVNPLTPKHYYNIGGILETDIYVSPSKLEDVYQSPFDFVCEKVLKMPQSDERNDLSTTYGTVAHRVVELLVEKGRISRRAFPTDSEYNDIFKQAVREVGIALLEDVNELKRYNFKQELHESLLSLQNVFRSLGFEPVECECQVVCKDFAKNKTFKGFGQVNCSIDLIIKNDEDQYAIVDFKWSKNNDKYSNYLKYNTSVQLEMYKHLYELSYGRKVDFLGYYLFTSKEFLVSDSTGITSVSPNVKAVASQPDVFDLWETLQHSFKFRMEEVGNGILEEGANMAVHLLSYENDHKNYPLKKQKDEDVKAYTYCYRILKNQLS